MALRVRSSPEIPGSRLADPRAWVAGLGIATLGLSGLIVRDLYFPQAASTAAVRTQIVQVATVRNVVSGTGNLVPATQSFVAFKVAGTLTEVDVKVGDKVTLGEVLARIDASTLQAAVDIATANLLTAQANLDSVLTPLTADQLAQLRHSLASAQQSSNDTVSSVNLTNQQDAVNVASDQQTLGIDQAAAAQDEQTLTNSVQLATDRKQLVADQARLAGAQQKFNDDGCAAQAPPFSGICGTDYSAVRTSQAAVSAGQTKVTQDVAMIAPSYATDLARVSADTAKLATDQARQTTDQVSGQQKINSSQNAITLAQDALNTQSSVKASALTQAQSAVANAQTALTTATQNLAYATLTAPSAGVVLSINGQPGENVGTATGVTAQSPGSTAPLTSTTAGTSFMVISSAGSFQAQAPFAETDAAKVQGGQAASITFDAISGLAIPAHVLAVAPNSTTVSSVVNYLITFTLDRVDPRIRPGMTVNIAVTVNSIANTPAVANAAIHRSGRSLYVTVLKNGRQQNTIVTVGLVGDSTTQVLTGLVAGDKVVLPTVNVGAGGNRGSGGGVIGTGGGSFGGGGARGPGG